MIVQRHTKAITSFWQLRRFGAVNMQYYDGSELQKKYIKQQMNRLFRTMKLLEQERFFQYEKKKAKYDPKTGKIELYNIEMKEPKKVIKSYDDLEKEKEKLHKEFKLTPEDAENASVDELSEGYAKLIERNTEGYKIDPADFYAKTLDHMRVDCGLIIMRPAIFLYATKEDRDFQLERNKIMNEYYLDMRQYYEDFKKETSVVDSILSKNPLVSLSNRDNLPTHELKEEDGTVKRY